MRFLKAVLAVALLFAVALPLSAKFIFLKDGTVIEGDIVDNGQKVLIIRDLQKKRIEIPQEKVSMILSSKRLNLDKKKGSGSAPEKKNFSISADPSLFLPAGSLGKMSSTGYGAMGSFTRYRFYSETATVGASAGFFYAQGKNLPSRNLDCGRLILVPLFLNAGCRFPLSGIVSVLPSVSFGTVHIDMKYSRMNNGILSDRNYSAFEPAVKAGVRAQCRLNDAIAVTCGGDYGLIFEKNSTVGFAVVNAGLDYAL